MCLCVDGKLCFVKMGEEEVGRSVVVNYEFGFVGVLWTIWRQSQIQTGSILHFTCLFRCVCRIFLFTRIEWEKGKLYWRLHSAYCGASGNWEWEKRVRERERKNTENIRSEKTDTTWRPGSKYGILILKRIENGLWKKKRLRLWSSRQR